jgi:hypothetical protein
MYTVQVNFKTLVLKFEWRCKCIAFIHNILFRNIYNVSKNVCVYV